MKLYATVSSERATKGQGGNEIRFTLQDENEACVMEMFVLIEKNNAIVKDFWVGDMNDEEIKNYYKKGEQKKGECKCNMHNGSVTVHVSNCPLFT